MTTLIYLAASLPYPGSKKRLLKKLLFNWLISIISQEEWANLTFIDAFAGGGSVSQYAKLQGFGHVISNDMSDRSQLFLQGILANDHHKLNLTLAQEMALYEGESGDFIRNNYGGSVFSMRHATALDKSLSFTQAYQNQPQQSMLRLLIWRRIHRFVSFATSVGTSNRPFAEALDGIRPFDTLNPKRFTDGSLERLLQPCWQGLEKDVKAINQSIFPAVGQIDGSTNITIIGTCLHDESLMSYLLARPDWTAQKYQAIEAWTEQQDLWDKWQAIYTDLSNPHRDADAQAFYDENQSAMLKGTQVLWPEVEPYLKLMKQLVGDGRRAFFSEKQNEPFDPSEQLFNMETAHYFEWRPETQTLHCLNRNRTVVLADLHTIVAFHDPCLGESDLGDYAAIVVAGKDYHGHLYVLDAFIDRCKPEQQIEAAAKLYERWPFQMLVLEGNGFQRLLLDSYNRRFSQYPEPPRILKVSQTGDKELRIATLQPYIEQGILLFNQALDRKLIDQLSYFPSASHDDRPDALEGAVNLLLSRRGEAQGQRRNPKRRPSTHRRSNSKNNTQ